MASRRTVLVVEDDDAIRYGTRLRLEMQGYEVLTAANGHEGVAITREHLPDVVLMDIRMPTMDGLTALRTLKSSANTSAIPIVIASASPGDQTTALDTGAKFFLTKPFSNDSLLAAIASAL